MCACFNLLLSETKAQLNATTYEQLMTAEKPRYRLAPCNIAIDPVEFDSNTSWHGPLVSEHWLALQWTRPKKGEDEIRTAAYHIHWCGLCGKWLCQLIANLDQQAAGDEELIGEIIRVDGYAGVQMADMMIRPALDPFCVHNASMGFWDRFNSVHEPNNLRAKFIKQINDLDDDRGDRCPASRDVRPFYQSYMQQTRRHEQSRACCLIWSKTMASRHGSQSRKTKRGAESDEEAQATEITDSKKRAITRRPILHPKLVNTTLAQPSRLNINLLLLEKAACI